MKGLRRMLGFPLLCLMVGSVVFGVAYTMMGQGPGDDEAGPGGNVNDPPATPGPNPTPGGSEAEGEPGPVGQVNELKRALRTSDIATLKSLLESGADPNTVVNDKGKTVLHRAMLFGSSDPNLYSKVKTLLDHGANPNLTDNKGRTPLHVAARSGDQAIMTALLDSGGDPLMQIPGKDDSSPYAVALRLGNVGVVSVIEDRNSYRHPDRNELLTWGLFGREVGDGIRSAKTVEGRHMVVRDAIGKFVTDLEERDRQVAEIISELRKKFGDELWGGE